MRKLQEDSQWKQNQWKMFEDNMKEMFTKEKAKHQKDQDAITKELRDLEVQKSSALQALSQILDTKHVPPMPAPMDATDASADRAWEDFTRNAQSQVKREQQAADMNLAQALLAAQDPSLAARRAGCRSFFRACPLL